MRVVRLVLLGLFVYVVAVVFLFPAAPVIDQVKPQLSPIALSGVSGKLFKGEVASVQSTDDLLPLELSDVKWSFSPLKLLTGTGASIEFSGLGGGGDGHVLRTWGGDLAIDDLTVNIAAPELEAFLPVPIASFKGNIQGEFPEARLVSEQLTRLLGQVRWTDAQIDTSVFGPQLQIAIGTLNIDIEPQDSGAHQAKINATGGDIVADGSVSVQSNGDFNLNILLTPSSNTPPELVNHLRRTTRPESGGRFRWQETGNVNRLM